MNYCCMHSKSNYKCYWMVIPWPWLERSSEYIFNLYAWKKRYPNKHCFDDIKKETTPFTILDATKGKGKYSTRTACTRGNADAPLYVICQRKLVIFCGCGSGWALIALGKEAECVNLADEVVHAGPPSKAKADYQHPYHYKRVHYINGSPARKEERKLFCRILHTPELHN